jgi:MFS family permease
MNRQVMTLALCQALFLTNNVALVLVNGLVGLALAPAGWMATLPITAYVAGGALATMVVAPHQQRFGRRRGFQLGLAVGGVAMLAAAVAVTLGSFAGLLAATLLGGYYSANAALYRFAAAEVAAPDGEEKAISWVLAGGLLGAIVGPNLVKSVHDGSGAPFAGVYGALALLAVLGFALVSSVEFPKPGATAKASAAPPDAGSTPSGRTLEQLLREPALLAAVASCAIGYGVMNLLMAASPIAMAHCGHSLASAALVIEWHVIGMYAPSFVTGHLIKRWGVLPVLAAGVALCAACIALALSGQDLEHFVAALFVLGVGWNFLYIGGTTLATRALAPAQAIRGQAAVDFAVFATMTFTSFASGALVTTGGWRAMNAGSLVALVGLAVLLWHCAVRASRHELDWARRR